MFRFIKSIFHPYIPIQIERKPPKIDPWESVYALIRSLGSDLERETEYIEEIEGDLDGTVA